MGWTWQLSRRWWASVLRECWSWPTAAAGWEAVFLLSVFLFPFFFKGYVPLKVVFSFLLSFFFLFLVLFLFFSAFFFFFYFFLSNYFFYLFFFLSFFLTHSVFFCIHQMEAFKRPSFTELLDELEEAVEGLEPSKASQVTQATQGTQVTQATGWSWPRHCLNSATQWKTINHSRSIKGVSSTQELFI